MYLTLSTPVYLSDEGPEGAIWLFLIAILGFVLLLIGRYADENADSCLGFMAGEFLAKLGVAMMLTGIISGIISLL